MKLGIPYMGGKRKLSKQIIDFILAKNPNCKYFYDLFGGGGAIKDAD
jgi:site-specific DNA-adenine methylase